MEIQHESVEFVSFQETGGFIAACLEVLPTDRAAYVLHHLGVNLSREMLDNQIYIGQPENQWDKNSFGQMVLYVALGSFS